ncbi:hypothetical protein SKAU_G00333790 [Synaphobranchus kaupii]|uniref:Uncharacterized protein n=1 Tax=Synaphobranchus kaupii TaxID=118154 RepID=A0A9Q1ELM9_SYNKA|nr:hypothetical protein SKAU_G00333790 [Synaphobranchus kaupii]
MPFPCPSILCSGHGSGLKLGEQSIQKAEKSSRPRGQRERGGESHHFAGLIDPPALNRRWDLLWCAGGEAIAPGVFLHREGEYTFDKKEEEAGITDKIGYI